MTTLLFIGGVLLALLVLVGFASFVGRMIEIGHGDDIDTPQGQERL